MPKSLHSPGHRRLTRLLREVRTEAGLTQVELADRLGRTQSFVAKVEGGERRVDLIELDDICKALGIGLVEFVQRFDAAGRRKR